MSKAHLSRVAVKAGNVLLQHIRLLLDGCIDCLLLHLPCAQSQLLKGTQLRAAQPKQSNLISHQYDSLVH